MGGHTKKTKPKYGLILLDPNTQQVFVVRRINYSLYDRINNNKVSSHSEMMLSMYPGTVTECMYEFPKGNREKGETGLDCALREFSEETGIKIDLESGLQLKKPAIKVEKLSVSRMVTENYVGENKIKYVLKYYIILIDCNIPKDPTIIETKNRKVLADNFNIVIYTKWTNVKRFFQIQNLNKIIFEIDMLCGLDKVNITKN